MISHPTLPVMLHLNPDSVVPAMLATRADLDSAIERVTKSKTDSTDAGDLLKLGVIHRIVYEPKGGAHRDAAETVKRLTLALRANRRSHKGRFR